MKVGIEIKGSVPFRLPCDGTSSSEECVSIDVAGRGRAVVPRVIVDWLNCDLLPYEDFGRPFGPTLLEKLPFEVLREDTDGAREDVEDVKDGFRLCIDFYNQVSPCCLPFSTPNHSLGCKLWCLQSRAC